MRYNDEMKEFLKANCQSMEYEELTEEFNTRFNQDRTDKQIENVCFRFGFISRTPRKYHIIPGMTFEQIKAQVKLNIGDKITIRQKSFKIVNIYPYHVLVEGKNRYGQVIRSCFTYFDLYRAKTKNL